MCRWSSMCWPMILMPMEISTRPACRSWKRRSMAWRKSIPSRGQITYTPATGFIGLDTLLYRVFDATEKSATATVRIDVLPTSDPPHAVDDAAETPEDTPVSIDVAANDTDADGDLDPRSVRILVGPLQGTAEVDPRRDGSYTRPPRTSSGDELLWYEIRDARANRISAWCTSRSLR